MLRFMRWFICSALVLAALVIAGRRRSQPPTEPQPAREASEPAESEHAHKPSAHGGRIIPLGRDRYHAETVFSKDGSVSLYTLGREESSVLEVPEQRLQAHARPTDGGQSVPFTLEPRPQQGDGVGKTSAFVGALPEGMKGRSVEVTIPSLRVGEERFRLSFSSPIEQTRSNVPAKVTNEKERRLYLTPQGRYTANDIESNGKRTASEKFAGFDANHDTKPKSGEAICPITFTRANPECSWVVDGKTYTFCCPPCVDEFVRQAKEKPDSIGSPESYRKK